MREADFDAWLESGYVGRSGGGLNQHDRVSRLWLARRIERYEGDLDAHYDRDGMAQLLERLTYARGDWLRGQLPRHTIPIERNAYAMTSDLRHAATLYRRFRDDTSVAAPKGPVKILPARGRALGQRDWPAWEQPSEEELLALARVITPLVRFLDPEIVFAVVEDNERHRAEWEAALELRGVDPSDYLWESSATVFPGVRRYTGKAEQRRFQENGEPNVEGVLQLDDNHYPKQVWSFALRGRPFSNFGPDGYGQAHLVDHKAYKHRGPEELVGPVAEILGATGLPGLFTSAANTVYVPNAFLRPTDFAGLLRNLLQRRAAELYGSRCRLLPGSLGIREAASTDWDTSAFTWSIPVGTTEYLAAFLDFRRAELERLLADREP